MISAIGSTRDPNWASSLYDGNQSVHNGTAGLPVPRQGNGDACLAILFVGISGILRAADRLKQNSFRFTA